MDIKVYNKEGQETGKTVSLEESIFGIEPNDHAIYLDVKQYLGNQRQGTHKAKERGEVKGSTKKLRKQKGTGAARVGDIKSPIFRGGGRIFGPKPRNYTSKMNKKVKRLARKSALTYKVKEESLKVVEDFTFDGPSTKSYKAVLTAFGLDSAKTLLVTTDADKNIYLSARNLQKAQVTTADELNTYGVLHADTLLVSEGALEKINEILKEA